MTRIAICENTSFSGIPRTAKVQRNERGFFKMVVGALNCYNSMGELYNGTNEVLALYGKNSALNRRCVKGLCKGEINHPVREAGMTKEAWIQRNYWFDPRFVNQMFNGFELEAGKDEYGKDVILVIAELIEAGVCADTLSASINNSEENLAWSFRGFSNPVKDRFGRTKERHITIPITYDSVSEGGFPIATKATSLKHCAMTLEEMSFNELELKSMELKAENTVTHEGASDIRMLRTDLGWSKVQTLNPDTFRSWGK